MSDGVMKQLVFDCAAELLHGQSNLSNEEIGNQLLKAIELHDKYVEGKEQEAVRDEKAKSVMTFTLGIMEDKEELDKINKLFDTSFIPLEEQMEKMTDDIYVGIAEFGKKNGFYIGDAFGVRVELTYLPEDK